MHIDERVIQAMAAFVFISVLKDFLICFYLHWTYEGRVNFYHAENSTTRVVYADYTAKKLSEPSAQIQRKSRLKWTIQNSELLKS